MKNVWRLGFTGASLALVSMYLAGGAAAETVLRARLNADIVSLEPGGNRDDNTDTVLSHLVEGLVAFRDDTTVAPMLAETVEISPDGLAYTFRLRQGVRFHNGATMTADDVVWSWNRYIDPVIKARCRDDFTGGGAAGIKITSITPTDANTVVFRLEKPSALFLVNMARTACGAGAIVHRSSVGADGAWNVPIGTGPYRLGEWRKAQFIDLVRFDRYASRLEPPSGLAGSKRALVDRARFVIIPDGTAAKAALLSGAIDILPDVAANNLSDLKPRTDVQLQTTPTLMAYAYLLQTQDPLLGDVKLRRAIAQALDTVAITAAVTEGTGQANSSAIPVSSPFHKAQQATKVAHDPAAARRLLAEAGYKGQSLKITATKQYPSIYDAAILAQAMLQEVGIKSEVETLDWGTLVSRFRAGNFQMMSFAYSAALDASLAFDNIIGAKAVEPRKVWDDPSIQEVLSKSMATLDPGARQGLLDELDRRMREATPIVYIFNPTSTAAARSNVVGYKGWPGILPRLWNVGFKQ